MTQILIGTASWTDKSLIDSGLLYPPEIKTPDERLRYYATQFPLVEVDSSYYLMPSFHNSVAHLFYSKVQVTSNVRQLL